MQLQEAIAAAKVLTEQEEALATAFKEGDKDGNGELDLEELKKLLEGLGVKMSDPDLEELMDEADADSSGTVSFEEFKKVPQMIIKEKEEEMATWFVKDSDKSKIRVMGCLPRDLKPMSNLNWNMYTIDEHGVGETEDGKERKGASTERAMVKEMTTQQMKKDAVVLDWSRLLLDGIKKANLVLQWIRHMFTSCVKSKLNPETVMGQMRGMLCDVVQTAMGADAKLSAPKVNVARNGFAKMFLFGKPAVKKITIGMSASSAPGGPSAAGGIEIIPGKPIKFTMQKTTGVPEGAAQFLFNAFFNVKHPSNFLNIFTNLAAKSCKAFVNAVKLGLKIGQFARKCLPPFQIIGIIATQILQVLMKGGLRPGFKARKIPGLLLKNGRGFAGMPVASMSFAKNCKKMLKLFGAMSVTDGSPAKALTDNSANSEGGDDVDDFVDGEVSKKDLGPSFERASKRANETKEAAQAGEAASGERDKKNKEEEPAEEDAPEEEESEEDLALGDAALELKFSEIDFDGDGEITEAELTEALKNGRKAMTDAMIKKAMENADKNGDGGIDIDEFKTAMRTGTDLAA